MRCLSIPTILTALGLSFSLLMLGSSASWATPYGNFSGDTVTFVGVGDQNGLFGMPVVSGDSLDFSPNAFEADCGVDPGCPPSPATIEDTLTLQIQADPGSFIDTVILNEAGDTSLFSAAGALGFTSVAAPVFIDIFAIDGVSVNNISAQAQMVFTSGGDFDTNTEGTGTHLWTGMLSIDFDQIIADAGATGRATHVGLNLNNILTAYAESGATARIEKKDIDGLAITVIPEPGTALLLGMGLASLALRRRSSMS